jgi:ribosome biogenesis GTPase
MNDTFDACVIATFGRHLLVRDAAGKELKARPFGRGLTVVCGDNVRCSVDPRHDEVHVMELIPRRTALYRSNVRGVTEPVVANLSQLLVVLAPNPAPDLFVVDRYLAAAASGGITGTLLVNKTELGLDDPLRTQLEVFSAAGYTLFGARRRRNRCASGGVRRPSRRTGRAIRRREIIPRPLPHSERGSTDR